MGRIGQCSQPAQVTRYCTFKKSNVWVNSKSDIPPGQTPGHLTFLKMIDQIPHYMGQFQGQIPHWLGLKSQNFHNLSGIDEYGTRIKKPGQKLHIYASHGSKIVMYLCCDFVVSKDSTRLSVRG